MKTTHGLVCITILISACTANKKEKVESMMKDPILKDEVIKHIINDSTTLMQFFETLHGGNTSPMRRTMHVRMMSKMYRSSGMDSIRLNDRDMRNQMLTHLLRRADRDSSFCLQMGDSIIRHRRLTKVMQQKYSPPLKRKQVRK